MQRIIVVHNPRSSKHEKVEKEVLARLRGIPGVQMGRYEIRPTTPEDNVARLKRILRDKDLVVAAGGDGTATIAMNGCMESGLDVSYAALPYGNFNDLARICKVKDVTEMVDDGKRRRRGKVVEAWPLEVIVDGEHWRYALGYVTIGLFAESTAVFDEKSTRQKLKSGRKTAVFSWMTLVKWYFKNRKQRRFLPEIWELNKDFVASDTTDYVAMNAPKMGGVMRGRNWFLDKREFYSGTAELARLPSLFWLMLRSILYMAPLYRTRGDELKFPEKTRVMIQAEGEYAWVEAKKIKVKKAGRSLKVIRNE